MRKRRPRELKWSLQASTATEWQSRDSECSPAWFYTPTPFPWSWPTYAVAVRRKWISGLRCFSLLPTTPQLVLLHRAQVLTLALLSTALVSNHLDSSMSNWASNSAKVNPSIKLGEPPRGLLLHAGGYIPPGSCDLPKNKWEGRKKTPQAQFLIVWDKEESVRIRLIAGTQ